MHNTKSKLNKAPPLTLSTFSLVTRKPLPCVLLVLPVDKPQQCKDMPTLLRQVRQVDSSFTTYIYREICPRPAVRVSPFCKSRVVSAPKGPMYLCTPFIERVPCTWGGKRENKKEMWSGRCPSCQTNQPARRSQPIGLPTARPTHNTQFH